MNEAAMLASSQIVLIHSREKRNSYLLILQYDIGYIHWLHRLGCSKKDVFIHYEMQILQQV